MITSHVMGFLLAGALVAAPALAQTTAAPADGGTPTIGTTTPNAAPGGLGSTAGGTDSGAAGVSTSAHNPVIADNGDIRISKVIGSSVYNDKNEKLGSVDEILVGKDNKADQAVISIGGVLGVGAKLVAVPYDKLKFADTVDNNTSRVMMPNTTADSLNGMPTFHYAGK